MEFTFEPSAWELAVSALKPGDTLFATSCIAMLQDLSEEEAEEDDDEEYTPIVTNSSDEKDAK